MFQAPFIIFQKHYAAINRIRIQANRNREKYKYKASYAIDVITNYPGWKSQANTATGNLVDT